MLTRETICLSIALHVAGSLAVPVRAQSQDTPSAVTVIVARETDPRRFSEPHLVVHPAKPNHLLAVAWSALTSDPENLRCHSFVSTDSGATWSRHDFRIADCYDAQVAILPDGRAVLVALGHVPDIRPDRADWLVVFNSADGGVTWNETPNVVGPRYDHPAITVDLSSSPRRGWVYITSHLEWADGSPQRKSAVVVIRSRDGGLNFDVPNTVMPSAQHCSSEMPVVLSDGTLVVSYQEFPWNEPRPPRRRLWVMRSADGGVTFSSPRLVNEECGPPPGFQLTSLGVDSSAGLFRDRLYSACRRAAGGPVAVFASSDHGDSWTAPGIVAGPAILDPSARRVMSIAVNNSGTLGVMVVERRPDSGPACLNVSLSISRDGAKNFVVPQVISATPCGDSPNDRHVQRRFPTYGDYFGIVAVPDGTFRLMWPEMRDGASTLLMATVKVQ